ncbi:MAG TPA: adenine deaminase [Bacteroidia bacterium]|nr:adenine deaminase [Bacteroidia bacterium]
MSPDSVTGQLIDVHNRKVYPCTVQIENGTISALKPLEVAPERYILPGFVDAHIHIESSMLTPYEFARKALVHGTVATVSDPHEIANVCGMAGVEYMIENARSALLKFHFGAPSCVPATQFETAGAVLGVTETERLLRRSEIGYLSEMMNYPGVLSGDEEVMAKIALAKKMGKPVDGHAPGLMGEAAGKYVAAGISTDHECFTKEEALNKLKYGMKILIREGSAARNFEALHELISEFPSMVMLCSDDKHPDELVHGHINLLAKRALQKGHHLFDVLQCACVNPVNHYNLNVGLLRKGDPADFVVVDDLENMHVVETWINGRCVNRNGNCVLREKEHIIINNFHSHSKYPSDFTVPAKGKKIRVINAVEGQLVTQLSETEATLKDGYAVADPQNNLLKIAVVNRYMQASPAVAFISNFKIQQGAIASTVAHDSHNIIAVGSDDESICRAVNLLMANKGGLSAVDHKGELVVPLPIAGLMSDKSCDEVGRIYSEIDQKVKSMGSNLNAPFMTLSFMALLVIPTIKLSDKGLFDGTAFSFTDLWVN